jgi:hypothetical protein
VAVNAKPRSTPAHSNGTILAIVSFVFYSPVLIIAPNARRAYDPGRVCSLTRSIFESPTHCDYFGWSCGLDGFDRRTAVGARPGPAVNV